MIKNYLKIGWRNLVKHKSFSIINILGLSIGLAACMIIFLYVHNELTFDQYNAKKDRIARIWTTLHTPESDMHFATSSCPLADALKRDFPEVEATVRFEPAPKTIKFNNDLIREDAFYKADPSVFSIFSFEFIAGSPTHALEHPHSIVITKSTAEKYFGKSPALGKTIHCSGEDLLITAVIKDRPANSDMPMDGLLAADFSKTTSWMDDFSDYTFVLFKTTPDLDQFNRKLASVGKYAQPELDAQGASNYYVKFQAEPLKAVHYSQGKLVDLPKGSRSFNYMFSLLALFVLIIALLNYINLSTAKSAERAKEVGVRKVSGALQGQLVRQFLFESFLLMAIAWILALGLVQCGLPLFNRLLQTKLSIDWTGAGLYMVLIFLISQVLAGVYPALVLSGFKPIQVLKGNWRHSGKGIVLRKIITVTQFAIAAALIMGTNVIWHQMKFIEQKDLGFNKNQLLNVYPPRDSAYISEVKAFQDDLRRRPEIHGITVGNGLTQDGISMASTKLQSEGKQRELMVYYYFIDPDFLSVFQIHLLEGRNLTDSFTTDKNQAFLVNEAFVKTMGWKSGLGQTIDGFGHKGKVVGVVRNFYFKSLHNLVEPLILIYNTFPANTTTVKTMPENLAMIKEIYKKHFPAFPFDYEFFDEMVSRQYKKDKITMVLFNDFTLLAILVSGLGLYGLVALITFQRTKEIGIRKVLGATIGQLFLTQTSGFFRLVGWALLIALPVAAIALDRWLSNYAYHVRLSWGMFMVPVLSLPLIALLVISRQVMKTAKENPVRSLRTE